MSHKNHHYRADIDGLRAIAIIAVIAFHAFPKIISGGFVGVDIFFVISGYLIFGIIERNLKRNTFSFFDFYYRRIRRIFPSLIIVLTFSLIIGWIFLYAKEYQELAMQAAAGAGFVANFELLRESGYFDNSAELKPLLHLWSLGIEEQFYILSPFLFWFCWKKQYPLLPIILSITAISFIFNITIINQYPSAAFYLPLSRFWEIAIGAALAQFIINNPNFLNSPRIPANFLSIAGFGTIILSVIFINKDQNFPGYLAIFPCLGAALIIASNPKNWINRHILSNKLMVGVGLISYPLYLWHWPLFSFAKIIKGKDPRLELVAGLIALSILLATLTYQFCEKPIRDRIKTKKHLLILIGLMLIIIASSLTIISNSGFESRSEANKNLLVRTTTRGDIYDEKCLKKYQEIGNNYCQIAGEEKEKKIFVIGDSHSQAIFNGYSPNFIAQDYQITHLANSGCPFIASDKSLNAVTAEGEDITKCNTTFQQILQATISQNPRAILFSNDGWTYRRDDFEDSMIKTLEMIPQTIPVIYFTQIPAMPFSPLKCIRDGLSCNFSKTKYQQEIVDYSVIIKKLSKQFSNLKIINPVDVLCEKNICRGSDQGGLFYYRDGKHLSIYGGLIIAEKLPISQYLTK